MLQISNSYSKMKRKAVANWRKQNNGRSSHCFCLPRVEINLNALLAGISEEKKGAKLECCNITMLFAYL